MNVVISKRMNHPNVLRIEGVAPWLFECCMVSRWMDHGNMLEYLNQYQGPINRLELVSKTSDHGNGVSLCSLIASSYLASSVALITYMSTESSTAT